MYKSGSGKIKSRVYHLDQAGNEILYVEFGYNSEMRLIKFSLNLTTKITAEGRDLQKEIVRYDCGHGHLHMHRFYRKPPTKEKIMEEISVQTAKELAQEIRENWKTWKKAMFENYGGQS